MKYASDCFIAYYYPPLLHLSTNQKLQLIHYPSSKQNKVDHRKWNFNVIFPMAHFK